MLRFRLIALILLICVGFSAHFLYIDVASAYSRDGDNLSWSWSDSSVQLVKDEEITDGGRTYECKYNYKLKTIYGVANQRKVCYKESNGIEIGMYYYGSGWSYDLAVGFPGDENMYHMSTVGSGEYNSALYLPGTDTLVVKQYIINNIVRSLVVYKNVSGRLSRHNDQYFPAPFYEFDASNPDYIFRSADKNLWGQTEGYAWPIGNFAASSNGKWLAVEFRDRGLGLLNIDNLQMRRMSALDIPYYGYGMDPHTELVVSDTGANVAIAGLNSGFALYDINDNCGELADDVNMQSNFVAKSCPKSSFTPFNYIFRPYTAFGLDISADGGELSVSVNSYDYDTLPRRITVRAAGYFSFGMDYLAMGDSFTSGEGELDDSFYKSGTNDKYEKCHQSIRSYPYLMIDYWGLNKEYSKSVACSGATTNDILGDDVGYWGQGSRLGNGGLGMSILEKNWSQDYSLSEFIPGRIHQISFANKYQPSVISIGIGGNDVGFADKLKACLMPGTCEWAGTAEGREKTAVEIKNLFDRLVQVYGEIHDQAPNSEIFAIGYPKIIDELDDCNLVDGYLLDRQERAFINNSTRYLDVVIHAAADKAGIRFIDNYDSFGDNILCGGGPSRAMNSIRGGDDMGIGNLMIIGQESFHPTADGHSMIAADFYRFAINPVTNPDYCEFNRKVCPNEFVAKPDPPVYFVPNGYHDYRLQHAADFVVKNDSIESTKELALSSESLQPNSPVQIFVASSPKFLGNFAADSRGGLNVMVNLPVDLEIGFHTLHIYGVDKNAEPVDIYQTIYYQKNDKTKSDNIINNVGNVNQETVIDGGQLPSRDYIGTNNDNEVLLSSETSLPVNKVKDQEILSVKDIKTNKVIDEPWMHLTLAIIFILLLVIISNRSRKTSGK